MTAGGDHVLMIEREARHSGAPARSWHKVLVVGDGDIRSEFLDESHDAGQVMPFPTKELEVAEDGADRIQAVIVHDGFQPGTFENGKLPSEQSRSMIVADKQDVMLRVMAGNGERPDGVAVGITLHPIEDSCHVPLPPFSVEVSGMTIRIPDRHLSGVCSEA
jgi:hypothetical protein